jgi:hypothetical protein
MAEAKFGWQSRGSANIEQDEQRETRQKKSRLASVAAFQSEQDEAIQPA